ncbi:MAG: HigA family addiction module antitoxin [Hyphomicrobiales bacterium]
MQMHNPPHPGEVIKQACLEPLGLTVTAAARWLCVSRRSLSELVNGRNGVSADMAIRLEKAFGGTAETWLRIQLSHDLWHAKQHAGAIKVKRFPVEPSAA